MRKYSWTLVLSGLAFTSACSNNQPTANNASGSASVATNGQTPIAQQLNAPGSPQTVVTPPAEVVAQFLDCLRRGDEVTTSQLLTTLAREEVAKHNLEVAPPGSPTATFQIGETREVESDRALVESIWSEPSNDGSDPIKTGVVFDVRLETNGWRLAGMVIDMGPQAEAIVVDFENMAGLLQPPAENTAGSSLTSPPPNLGPATTAVPAQNSNPGFSMPPQLASPPSSGSAGLRR